MNYSPETNYDLRYLNTCMKYPGHNILIKQTKPLLCILFTIFVFLSCSSNNDSSAFHTPESLNNFLEQVNQEYPSITRMETVGYSVENRIISSIIISDNPGVREKEPRIRLTGAVHGDENSTSEVLARLISYLTEEYYSGNTYVKSIIESNYIVIIPMLNPDGVADSSRWNADDVDLNRNFSEHFVAGSDHGDEAFSEPESDALRLYSEIKGFHSSLTFHTGAVVVNKPFDYAGGHDDGILPEESSLVDYLAYTYSETGNFLSSPGLLSNAYTVNGTINGGDWYVVYGSLQDWSYIKTGCIDLTVEIAVTEPDTKSGLDDLYNFNRDSILAYIEASGIGLYGRVTDSSTGEPLSALISISGGDIFTKSDSSGYYHRILLPGTYTVTFSADGYADYSTVKTITASGVLESDIQLTPQ